jgi:hypothetical protein
MPIASFGRFGISTNAPFLLHKAATPIGARLPEIKNRKIKK